MTEIDMDALLTNPETAKLVFDDANPEQETQLAKLGGAGFKVQPSGQNLTVRFK